LARPTTLKVEARYASDADFGARIWDKRLFLSISAISLILTLSVPISSDPKAFARPSLSVAHKFFISVLIVNSLHSLKLFLNGKGWQFGCFADEVSLQYLASCPSVIKTDLR
jgi:hypothetical protein